MSDIIENEWLTIDVNPIPVGRVIVLRKAYKFGGYHYEVLNADTAAEPYLIQLAVDSGSFTHYKVID